MDISATTFRASPRPGYSPESVAGEEVIVKRQEEISHADNSGLSSG